MSLLTIITINRNNAAGLERTLKSVQSQTIADFEYIVVDGTAPQPPIGGAKTDLEVLKCFIKNQFTTENNFTHCSWLSTNGEVSGGFFSEPDTGIYNAMNKGIKMANGEYLLFINSGDELADNNVVKNFVNAVNTASEICSGNLLLIKNSGQLSLNAPTEITLSYCVNAGLTHPNTFIRKYLFEKHGLYNEANKIVSDWEFFLIAAGLNTCKYQQLSFTVARFYEDGISSQNKALLNSEMEQIINRLVPEALVKDLRRLQYLEQLLSHPAYILIQQSAFMRKMLKTCYKLGRSLGFLSITYLSSFNIHH